MPAAVKRTTAGRVLLTTDAVGGVWTYALDLARGLSRAGLETTLVVMGPSPSPDQAAEAAEVPGLALVDTGLALDWTAAGPDEVRRAGESLREVAIDAAPDLIHLNSPALAAVGGFPAPVLGACHSCLATWWGAVKAGPPPADFAWRIAALRDGLTACDALAAPTQAFARATGRAYGLPTPQVVWNGRAAGPGGQPMAEREPMVFTAGRLWDEGKNVAVLDAAAARISAPVYAAGPLQGPVGGAAELSHARPLGRLTGSEVATWLARSPVYATSALYEPFGLGVLEAAQAGCALVLSDIATLRELWDGAAVFVAPRDAGGFARACERLLQDAGERERLGGAARSRAERYTAARMTAGTLALYGRLAPRLAREAEVAA